MTLIDFLLAQCHKLACFVLDYHIYIGVPNVDYHFRSSTQNGTTIIIGKSNIFYFSLFQIQGIQFPFGVIDEYLVGKILISQKKIGVVLKRKFNCFIKSFLYFFTSMFIDFNIILRVITIYRCVDHKNM